MRPEESAEPTLADPLARHPGSIRRLYDWMLHWADTRHGPAALFLLTFAESSFFPIPPDPLLMALCLGSRRKALRFAGIATMASVVGGVAAYGLGTGAWGVLDEFFFRYVPGVTPEAFAQVGGWYERYNFWAIFIAGLTPIPYKVFTLSAGAFGINFGVFVVASIASRGLRFFLEAALIRIWGDRMAGFIDRHFDRLTIAFGILLIGGFLVIEFLL